MEYFLIGLLFWLFCGYMVGMAKSNITPSPSYSLVWAFFWCTVWPVLWIWEAASGIDNP